jgi:hypothetical protein
VLESEPFDVLHEFLHRRHVRHFGCDIVGVLETTHPPRREHGWHGRDQPELVSHGFHMFGSEDSCLHRRRVGVIGERVPATELELVERREGDEVLDEGVAVLCALAEPDVAELGYRSDGLGDPLTCGEDPRKEGGCDGTHAGCEYAELAGGGCDVERCHGIS